MNTAACRTEDTARAPALYMVLELSNTGNPGRPAQETGIFRQQMLRKRAGFSPDRSTLRC
jgi:hypothetical protein